MTWEAVPIPGGWEYRHSDSTARIILDYVFPTQRGLEAWVELRMDDGIPVAQGQQNLMAVRSTQPFLADVDDADTVPWRAGLRQAFYETINAWREGAPTVDLATIESSGLEWILDPLVEAGGNTRIIAPGGSGKSLFAMALALAVSTGSSEFLGLKPRVTGPVLYLDWETNAATHAQRIKALCAPAGVPFSRDLVYYRFEDAPLARSVQAVSRAVRETGAIMLVVDSAMMAAGTSGQSSGEDTTGNLFTALRQIAKPAAVVDHKSSEAIRTQRLGGYGSVYKENLARLQYEFTSYSRTPDRRRFILTLTKENNVGDVAPIGFELVTKGGKDTGITSAVFNQVDAESVRAVSEDADLANRIFTLLSSSDTPMPVRKMSEMLGVKDATVRARLTRDQRFVNVAIAGAGRWRLADGLLSEPRDDGFQGELEPPDDEPEMLDDLDREPPTNFRDGGEIF
jgi:hypothetical protein